MIKKTPCSICFDSKNLIDCFNYFCDSKLCKDCKAEYIRFSIKDNTVPFCINKKCKFIYNSNEPKYEEVMMKYIQNTYIDKIEVIKKNNSIIEQMKQKKLDFVNGFPNAIKYIIKNVLHTKFDKITRENDKFITKEEERSVTKCYSILCEGYINVDSYTCNVCDTEYCKECEQVNNKNHICDENILESLKLIDTFISCPKCQVKVIKESGCNYITCSNCNNNFYYVTGEASEHGSHSKNKLVEHKEHKLHVLYRDEYPMNFITILIKIEKFQPLVITTDSFLKLMVDSNKDNDKDEFYTKRIIKQFHKYLRNNIQLYIYTKIVQSIEQEHIKNKLTEEYLLDTFNLLSN